MNSICFDKIYGVSNNFRLIHWLKENEWTCINLANASRIDLTPTAGKFISLFNGYRTLRDVMSYIDSGSEKMAIEYVKRLLKLGILVDSNYMVSEEIFEKYETPPIETLIIEITGKCNAHCKFCYAKDSRHHELSFDLIKKVIMEFKEIGGQIVAITGGEPTIHPQLYDIIKEIRKNRLLLAGIGTNGYFFPEKLIKLINEGPLADSIAVSLDSLDENFQDTMRGLKFIGRRAKRTITNLCKSGIPVTVNTLITKKLAQEYEKFGDTLSELGVKRWRIIQPHGIEHLRNKDSVFMEDPLLELKILYNVMKAHKDRKWQFELMSNVFMQALTKSYEELRKFDAMKKLCMHRSRVCYVRADGAILRCNISRKSILGFIQYHKLKDIWSNPKTWKIKTPDFKRPNKCDGCKAKDIGLCNANYFCPEQDIIGEKFICRERLGKIADFVIQIKQSASPIF